jgi:hypothetical protein
MKTIHRLILTTVPALLIPFAPSPAAVETPPSIVERGPHSRVWQWTTSEERPGGVRVAKQHTVVELATGMHYWAGDQWAESQELIEPFPDGAVARHGQHKAIFAPNLNTRGAIDLEMPDGRRLQSHILGLAYTDAATGSSVLIAEIKDCAGEILPLNQVIYRDAFTDLKADVRYTYTRAGLEQDIILRQQPASPGEFGLNPATTRIEVFTELLDPPAPAVTRVRRATGGLPSQLPDTDDEVSFGAGRLGAGRAFDLGVAPPQAKLTSPIRVNKEWTRIDGRQFLIEKVSYPGVFWQASG